MAIDINWWAILVTTVISFGLGNLWFGPLFGKYWMKVVLGMTPEECKKNMDPAMKRAMVRSMILTVVTSVIMNFVLLHSIVFGSAYLGISGAMAGLQAALWNWLGFVATVTLGAVLFENRPWRYWFVLAGFYLVAMLINGMVLASWM
jgi:hypothetical protein